jgi:hypothetical protein
MARHSRPAGQPFGALAVALDPNWHDAVLRLAKATERVAEQLGALMGDAAEGPDSYRAQLRKLAADTLEILDGIDGDSDLEPSFGYFDGCRPGVDECEPSDDTEPDLGAFDRMINQERSWKTAERNVDHYGWSTSQELDDSDHEPSLGGALNVDQSHWSDGNFTDREPDLFEAG